MKPLLVFIVLMMGFLLPGCEFITAPVNPGITNTALTKQSTINPVTLTPKLLLPSVTLTPTQTVVPDLNPTVQPTLISPTGPDSYPQGINPLTGLPVSQAESLKIPPALISITNWPVSARPQAGLSFSPLVFELYIGEGMSRLLALFYGDYPTASSNNGNASNPSVGPIRSGRLPYEHLRGFYNGFLVMASAYPGVAQYLGQYTNVFGSDTENINSGMIDVTHLAEIGRASQVRMGDAALSGLAFDPAVPVGGKPAGRLWFMYNAYDQVLWRYSSDTGGYHRFQDNADGKTFVEAVDRLNHQPLSYGNIILLFANHRACNEAAFDVDLGYINREPALLFRDGRLYEIYWTTKNDQYEQTTGKLRPIRFMDADGNPFPLKPGQTWVHLVPLNTPYWETTDTMDLYRLLHNPTPGSGLWAARFFASQMITDPSVCKQLRSK